MNEETEDMLAERSLEKDVPADEIAEAEPFLGFSSPDLTGEFYRTKKGIIYEVFKDYESCPVGGMYRAHGNGFIKKGGNYGNAGSDGQPRKSYRTQSQEIFGLSIRQIKNKLEKEVLLNS